MSYILGIVILGAMLAGTVFAYLAYSREADRLFARKTARQAESAGQPPRHGD